MKQIYSNTLLATILLAASAPAQTPAIPEPPAIFYGSYTAPGAGAPSAPASVTWTITGNSETVQVSSFTIVLAGAETFYLSRIPWETRRLADNTALTPTPGTLELTLSDTSYTRSVEVDGEAASLPAGQESFTYGANSQGLTERLDLTGQPVTETYEQWSQRIFGAVVSRTGDADGDGRTNEEEFASGTDPTNPSSRFDVRRFTALPSGSFELEIESQPGFYYRLEKSATLTGGSWSPVGQVESGTGNPLIFSPASEPVGTLKMFYRVKVSTVPP